MACCMTETGAIVMAAVKSGSNLLAILSAKDYSLEANIEVFLDVSGGSGDPVHTIRRIRKQDPGVCVLLSFRPMQGERAKWVYLQQTPNNLLNYELPHVIDVVRVPYHYEVAQGQALNVIASKRRYLFIDNPQHPGCLSRARVWEMEMRQGSISGSGSSRSTNSSRSATARQSPPVRVRTGNEVPGPMDPGTSRRHAEFARGQHRTRPSDGDPAASGDAPMTSSDESRPPKRRTRSTRPLPRHTPPPAAAQTAPPQQTQVPQTSPWPQYPRPQRPWPQQPWPQQPWPQQPGPQYPWPQYSGQHHPGPQHTYGHATHTMFYPSYQLFSTSGSAPGMTHAGYPWYPASNYHQQYPPM